MRGLAVRIWENIRKNSGGEKSGERGKQAGASYEPYEMHDWVAEYTFEVPTCRHLCLTFQN